MTTTTETDTSTFALTAQHVKCLRTADQVCFDHKPGPDGGKGQIRAVKRTPKDPWEKEKEVVVPAVSHVQGGEVVHYGDTANADLLTCFDMIYSAQYDEEWKTIASLLKVGDEITLTWSVGGGNNYLKWARVAGSEVTGDADSSKYRGDSLHYDRLYLAIYRGGKKKYSFLVANSVCPNNSARMVRGL